MTSTTSALGGRVSAPESEPRVAADHFGGPGGALVLTIVLPLITYYLNAAIHQHGGQLWFPRGFDQLLAMVPPPTSRALAIYGVWLGLHVLLALVAPGKIVDGATLRDGTRLPYKL